MDEEYGVMNYEFYIENQLRLTFSADQARSFTKFLVEDIPTLNTFSKEQIDQLLLRLKNGAPIQYVTGVAPFYGHFFNVNESVLIPRPETEELVYTIEKYLKKERLLNARIIDIGTGSGCIPITLSTLFPKASIKGIDVSKNALEVALKNNEKLSTSVVFECFDFLDEENWSGIDEVDIIVSNPPYIPHSEKELMHSNVLDHEPHLALFVDNENPLLFYKKINEFASSLKNQVAVFLECNEYNALDVKTLFDDGFIVEVIQDLQGKDRIVKAIKNL